jgi:hypothetical protein
VLRYVAVLDGEWVALVGFGSAALSCAARDGFLGWSREAQYARLRHVVNNQRFCVLPAGGRPNLASAVLSRVLRRLAGDHLAVYGHRVLAVETFTDPAPPGTPVPATQPRTSRCSARRSATPAAPAGRTITAAASGCGSIYCTGRTNCSQGLLLQFLGVLPRCRHDSHPPELRPHRDPAKDSFLPGSAGQWLMTRDIRRLDDGGLRTDPRPPTTSRSHMTTEHLGTGEPGLVTSTAHPAKPEILVRVGVVAALACGALTTLHEVWEDAIPGIQQGAGWSLLHTSWLAAMFVAFLGITAVQRPGLDKFGRIATRTALVGTGAQTIMAAIETGTLVGRTPTSDDPAAPILAAILAVFAVYVAGMILLSVATIRAGVLPRSAGAVLLLAVLLKMFASGAIPGTLALLGLAVAWVGLAAWRAARQCPVQPQTSGPLAATL